MSDRPRSTKEKRATAAMVARAKRILAGDIRAEDYLPVPAEVRDGVHELLGQFGKGRVSKEYTQLLLNEWTLSYHHGGRHVLYKKTDEGVIVLAVGEMIGAFCKEFTNAEDRLGTIGTVPNPWQALALPISPRL